MRSPVRGRARPAIAAGRHDSSASACPQVRTPGSTSSVMVSARLVSSPSMPGRRLLERALLLLHGVRRVVGGDGIDGAVGETGAHGGDVGRGAQGWVHLEHRIEPGAALVGEGEVVRCCFGGDAEGRAPSRRGSSRLIRRSTRAGSARVRR